MFSATDQTGHSCVDCPDGTIEEREMKRIELKYSFCIVYLKTVLNVETKDLKAKNATEYFATLIFSSFCFAVIMCLNCVLSRNEIHSRISLVNCDYLLDVTYDVIR